MRLYTRSEHHSPRVEASIHVRGNFFAEFIFNTILPSMPEWSILGKPRLLTEIKLLTNRSVVWHYFQAYNSMKYSVSAFQSETIKDHCTNFNARFPIENWFVQKAPLILRYFLWHPWQKRNFILTELIGLKTGKWPIGPS